MAAGYLQVAYDFRVITEYREVLNRAKFGLKPKEINTLLAQIEEEGVLVTAKPLKYELLDPDDKPFLEIAQSIKNGILVTGNKKHFPTETCQNVLIMSPSEFIEYYLSK